MFEFKCCWVMKFNFVFNSKNKFMICVLGYIYFDGLSLVLLIGMVFVFEFGDM